MVYLLYSFLYFFVGFLIVNQNQEKKRILYWYYLGVVLFFGLSYREAIDTPIYMDYYDFEVVPLSFGFMGRNKMEAGFNFIAQICKSISPHYVLFQMVLFTSEMFLVFKGLQKLVDEKVIIYVIPLLFFMYPTMLNAPRQGVAIAFFIYGLHFLYEKHSWRYFIFVFLGFLFHQSAIVLVVFYFVKYLKTLLSKNWLIFTFLILCDVVWVAGISISNNVSFITNFLLGDVLDMGEKYATYYIYDEDVLSNVGIAKVVEVNATVFLYTLFCKGKKCDELYRFILLMYVFFILSFGGMFAHRILYYFSILYYVCFIHGVMGYLSERTSAKPRLGYFVIALYMMWFNLLHGSVMQHPYILLF